MTSGIDFVAALVAAVMILGPMAAGAMNTAHDRSALPNAEIAPQRGQ